MSVAGFPIVGSAKVSDSGMLEAAWFIERVLDGREDILKAMTDNNVRSGVMAITERRTDIPEHSDLTPNEYWDRRARGLGAMPQRPAVSGAEESALRSGRSLFDGKHPHPRIRARGSRDGDEHD